MNTHYKEAVVLDENNNEIYSPTDEKKNNSSQFKFSHFTFKTIKSPIALFLFFIFGLLLLPFILIGLLILSFFGKRIITRNTFSRGFHSHIFKN